jgi:hypothetical protein
MSWATRKPSSALWSAMSTRLNRLSTEASSATSASHEFYPDWELFADMCVGVMRAEAGRDPHDRGLHDLVGKLAREKVRVALGAPGTPDSGRYEAIAVIAAQSLPVQLACLVLGVSESGYYDWRSRQTAHFTPSSARPRSAIRGRDGRSTGG